MKPGVLLINDKSLCDIQADFCSVFANPIRIRILLFLQDSEKTAGELAELLEISAPNLSQHLRLMKDRNCLVSRKEGKHVFFRVTSPVFLEAMNLLRKGIVEVETLRQSKFQQLKS